MSLPGETWVMKIALKRGARSQNGADGRNKTQMIRLLELHPNCHPCVKRVGRCDQNPTAATKYRQAHIDVKSDHRRLERRISMQTRQQDLEAETEFKRGTDKLGQRRLALRSWVLHVDTVENYVMIPRMCEVQFCWDCSQK